MGLDWKLSDAETIVRVEGVCDRFDTHTTPWATADLAEEVECTVNRRTIDLPRAAWDRYMHCLDVRDSKDLDYDSPTRLEQRGLA